MRKQNPADDRPALIARQEAVAAPNGCGTYDKTNNSSSNSNAMSVNSIAATCNSSAKADRRPLVHNRSKNPAAFIDESRDEVTEALLVVAAMLLHDILQGYNDAVAAVGGIQCGEGDRHIADDDVRDGVEEESRSPNLGDAASSFSTPRTYNHRLRRFSAVSDATGHSSLLQPTTASWTSEPGEGATSALVPSLGSIIFTNIDVMERSISRLMGPVGTRLEGTLSDLDDEEDAICYSFSLSGTSIVACESVASVASAPIEEIGRESSVLVYFERVVHIPKRESDVKIIDITESFAPGGGFAIECKLSEPSEKEIVDTEDDIDKASIETEILHARRTKLELEAKLEKLRLAAEEEARTKEAAEPRISESKSEAHGCSQSSRSQRCILGKTIPSSSLFKLRITPRQKRNTANQQAEEPKCEVSLKAEQEGVRREETRKENVDANNEELENGKNFDADDESMGEADIDIEQESNTDGLTVALVRIRFRDY